MPHPHRVARSREGCPIQHPMLFGGGGLCSWWAHGKKGRTLSLLKTRFRHSMHFFSRILYTPTTPGAPTEFHAPVTKSRWGTGQTCGGGPTVNAAPLPLKYVGRQVRSFDHRICLVETLPASPSKLSGIPCAACQIPPTKNSKLFFTVEANGCIERTCGKHATRQ